MPTIKINGAWKYYTLINVLSYYYFNCTIFDTM